MLVDLMTGKEIRTIPYAAKFKILEAGVTPTELAAMKTRLNEMIEGTEIQTAGWMPGKDWTGTVFAPIYDKAANKSFELSALLFGLLVYVVFMERPDRWSSGRFEKDGEPIGSRTYFRID